MRIHITPNQRWSILIIGAFVVLAAGGAVLFINSRPAAVGVPTSIRSKALFALFVPSQLPGSYKVIENSFNITEGIVLFSIRDDTGRTIAFTEQGVPAAFDFTTFYAQKLGEAKKVDGASYESVVGRNMGSNVGLMLSVRATDTWLLATSSSDSPSDLEFIAKHLQKQ